MFLELASTPSALDAATSNIICDFILSKDHFSSGLSPGLILLGADYTTDQRTVVSVRGSLELLNIAYKASTFPYHPLVHSASRLAKRLNATARSLRKTCCDFLIKPSRKEIPERWRSV